MLLGAKRKPRTLLVCGMSVCLVGVPVGSRQSIQWLASSLTSNLQVAPPPLQNLTSDAEFKDATPNSEDVSNTEKPPPPFALPGGSTGLETPAPDQKPEPFPTAIGSKGGLWIGTVHGERTVTYTRGTIVVHHFTNTMQVKLREVVEGVISTADPTRFHRIGSIIDLQNEGTKVDVGYQGAICSDHASRELTDNDRVGIFYYKTLDEPIKNGNELPPEGLYRLILGTGGPIVLPLCEKTFKHFDQLGGRPIEIGYLWGPHSAPPDPAKLASDAWDPQGYRKMSQNHMRMVGEYTYQNQFKDGSEFVKVNWDICRAGSAGCSEPPPDLPPHAEPPVPCDSNSYMADYAREFQTAQDLFKASKEHLDTATKDYKEWEAEEAKVMSELAVEKYDLLKTVELALEEGGIHLLHKATGWFGLATTAAWIYTDVYPHVRDHNQAVEDSAKMSATATDLATKAIDNLQKHFNENPACKEQREKARQKAIEAQKMLDAAKKLRDTWALDGSALYKEHPNDPNEYPMDAGAALKRAQQILAQASQTASSSNLSGPPSAFSFTGSASGQDFKVTVAQLRAVLAEVDLATKKMDAGRVMMKAQKVYEQKRDQQLNNVLKAFPQPPH